MVVIRARACTWHGDPADTSVKSWSTRRKKGLLCWYGHSVDNTMDEIQMKCRQQEIPGLVQLDYYIGTEYWRNSRDTPTFVFTDLKHLISVEGNPVFIAWKLEQ